jgi:pilus assembly protein CpaE
VKGGIADAIAQLSQRSWPRFLIVDVDGIADPLPQINRLAEISNPETEVIVVGERNDIVLYRDLKAAGVAEYFYKPLLGSLLGRAIADIGSGARNQLPSRSGKLIVFLGVRGGVGATTIATALAWYFAEVRQRGVLLLDLDLQAGDSALQLGAQPSHALREALDDPRRIDELFLERGVMSVTNHLGLLAGLEPLSDRLALNEEAVLALLQKLLTHYRYVLVDLPGDMVRSLPRLMRMPSTLVLVSDATLTSVREVGRWRDFLGPSTVERSILHVLNKKNGFGALPGDEMLRVIPAPDIALRWDRDIMSAASLGTKAVQRSSAMRDAVAALSVRLSGAASDEDRSLWQRIFG